MICNYNLENVEEYMYDSVNRKQWRQGSPKKKKVPAGKALHFLYQTCPMMEKATYMTIQGPEEPRKRQNHWIYNSKGGDERSKESPEENDIHENQEPRKGAVGVIFLCSISFLSLIKTSVLTLATTSTAPSVAIDHIRDPATNSFSPSTTGL